MPDEQQAMPLAAEVAAAAERPSERVSERATTPGAAADGVADGGADGDDPAADLNALAAEAWRAIRLEMIAFRVALGWSQADLARRIGYAQSQVSRWESGRAAIPRDAAAAILAVMTTERDLVREMRSAYRRLRERRHASGSSATWPRLPITTPRRGPEG